ncbi:hypothetical protein ABH925_002108 [Streptacidiphilus sp. EB129]
MRCSSQAREPGEAGEVEQADALQRVCRQRRIAISGA